MEKSRTFRFMDAEAAHEVLIIVRHVDNGVALCLSSSEDGDVEVVLSKKDFHDFVRELSQM